MAAELVAKQIELAASTRKDYFDELQLEMRA